MINKKEALLVVFYEMGNVFGRTFLQKLMFLINKEIVETFKYQAYLYGPFSSELNDTLNEFVSAGLIEEKLLPGKSNHDYYQYSLTESGKNETAKIFFSKENIKKKQKIGEMCKKFIDFNATELLRYVYQKYPDMARESKFVA